MSICCINWYFCWPQEISFKYYNVSFSYKVVESYEKYLVYQTHHGFLVHNCILFLNLQLPRQKNRGSLCCSLLHSQDWNSESLECYSSIIITLRECILSICVWKKTSTLSVFLQPVTYQFIQSIITDMADGDREGQSLQ